jgi:hypothetical protein
MAWEPRRTLLRIVGVPAEFRTLPLNQLRPWWTQHRAVRAMSHKLCPCVQAHVTHHEVWVALSRESLQGEIWFCGVFSFSCLFSVLSSLSTFLRFRSFILQCSEPRSRNLTSKHRLVIISVNCKGKLAPYPFDRRSIFCVCLKEDSGHSHFGDRDSWSVSIFRMCHSCLQDDIMRLAIKTSVL